MTKNTCFFSLYFTFFETHLKKEEKWHNYFFSLFFTFRKFLKMYFLLFFTLFHVFWSFFDKDKIEKEWKGANKELEVNRPKNKMPVALFALFHTLTKNWIWKRVKKRNFLWAVCVFNCELWTIAFNKTLFLHFGKKKSLLLCSLYCFKSLFLLHKLATKRRVVRNN